MLRRFEKYFIKIRFAWFHRKHCAPLSVSQTFFHKDMFRILFLSEYHNNETLLNKTSIFFNLLKNRYSDKRQSIGHNLLQYVNTYVGIFYLK